MLDYLSYEKRSHAKSASSVPFVDASRQSSQLGEAQHTNFQRAGYSNAVVKKFKDMKQ